MKKTDAKPEVEAEEIPEVDFSKGVRGKYYGETEQDAIHRAVEERYRRLTGPATPSERRQNVPNMLESSVWGHIPKDQLGRALSREEEDEIRGYGPEGV